LQKDADHQKALAATKASLEEARINEVKQRAIA
jgi:hypothetical protein